MNIVMAMQMGGDDFISKPVDLSVLTAKIQATLRRAYDFSGKTALLEHAGAVLNLNDSSLSFQGRRIELTRNEFRILQTLMEQKGKIVSRDQLMTRLWQDDCYVEENTLTVNVTRLRKKLEEDFSFMSYAPIVFISAKTGQRVDKLFETIHFVDVQNGTRVPTGALNEMLARATAKVQPPSDKGKRLKVFYITQISTRPPTFVCFVNQKALFHFSYQRYLENQIRETFGLTGTPIKMITREHGDGAVKAGKV